MFDQPYLETCCRAALHRLSLAGDTGRPLGLADEGCLRRLSDMGLSNRDADGRYRITPAGLLRHAEEIAPPAA